MWLKLLYNYNSVFLDGDGHTVLDVGEEFLAEAVDNGHIDVLNPNGSEDCARSREGVDMLGEEHTSGLTLHRASAVENKSARGRADRLGQTKSLAAEGLAVELGIVLVAAFGFLVAKLQSHLHRGESVKALCGNDGFSRGRTGGYNASFEFSHNYLPPFVIASKISSSV